MKNLKAIISLKIRDNKEIPKAIKKETLEVLENQTIDSITDALDFIKDKELSSYISNTDFITTNNKEEKVSTLKYIMINNSIAEFIFSYIGTIVSLTCLEICTYLLIFYKSVFIINASILTLIIIGNAIIVSILFWYRLLNLYNEVKDGFNMLVLKVMKSNNISDKDKKTAQNNITNYCLDSYSRFIFKLIERGEYDDFNAKKEIEDIYLSMSSPLEHTINSITSKKTNLNFEEKETITDILSKSSTFNEFLENLLKEKLIDKFNQNELANIQNTYK